MNDKQQNIYSALNFHNCEQNKKLPQKQMQIADSNQNPRFDKNGEEIIWRLKHKSSVGYFITILHLVFFSYILGWWFPIDIIENLINRDLETITMALALLVLLFIALMPIHRLFRLLNQKTIYLTKNHFIIERYLGKTKKLSLAEPLYICIDLPFWTGAMIFGGSSEVKFYKMRLNDKFPFGNIASFIESCGGTNIDEIYPYLLPMIEKRLLDADKNDFLIYKIDLQVEHCHIYPKVDWDKIDKLRDKQNDK